MNTIIPCFHRKARFKSHEGGNYHSLMTGVQNHASGFGIIRDIKYRKCHCLHVQLQFRAFRLASTNMDSVVNGNVNFHVAKHMKVCKMEEFGESVVWREAIGLVAIKTFLEAHGDVFDLEEWGETVMMRLKSTTHSTDQNQRAAAGSPSSITNSGVWRRSGHVHWDHKCVCLFTLKVLPRFGQKSSTFKKFNASSCVEGVCRMSLPVSSRVLNNFRNCP